MTALVGAEDRAGTGGAALLEVEHLSKSYGGVHAVRGVSFTLHAGRLLALIGPNGAGKSTCFNMLSGQIRPDQGRIRIAGTDIAGFSPARICGLGVGRTFQIAETFLSMTVRENVQMALLAHLDGFFGRRSFGGHARDAHLARADAILALIGLAADAERPCGELAYGDIKRLELAVALANDPKLLLMDEPAAGMAPRERIQLMKLASRIARERRIGILFTEHDMDVVFEHADWLMVLNRGRVIAEGPPQAIRNDPEVRAVYLGDGTLFAPAGAV